MARILLVVMMFGLGRTSPCQADPASPATQSGFAERDITPAVGMEQPGGYAKTFNTHIHDPCKARAAVFFDGQSKAAIVSLDAPFIRRETVLAARRRIEAECGIPGPSVLIHTTHSHSGGPLGMVFPGDYDGASELVRKMAYEETVGANPAYVKMVEDQIVAAVDAAHSALAEGKATVGKGHLENISFNRRLRMRNGMTYTHPGAGNPDIIEPAGPIDPDVGVLGVWNADGKLSGCIVTFCCHATTNPGGVSANYVFYLEQVIRGVFGEQTIVVFLAGPSGDVTQVNNLSKTVNPKPEQWARLVGSSIGAEVIKVLVQEEPGDLFPVATRSKVWKIHRRVPRSERVQAAEKIVLAGKEQASDKTAYQFAKETLMVNYLCRKEPEVEVEAQAVQIGPVVFLANPAELFCQYGLEIKQGSPFPLTFPVCLSNGFVAYVPTEEAFGPRGGGYETRLTSYTNLEITAGAQIVSASLELARQLSPGVVPQRAPLPQKKVVPWTFGSVPPELD